MPDDDATCASILAAAWNSALPDVRRSVSLDQFRDETLGETVLVAVSGEQMVGFVAMWEPESFIHHLYVRPDSQRSGVGSALLLKACSVVTHGRVWLKTQERNRIARDFYSAKGFRPTEDRGEDEYGRWIAMELLLDPSFAPHPV